MSLRIAIVGGSPCGECTAACCKQNGHEFAAILRGDERRRFAAFATDVPIHAGDHIIVESVLPYVAGRCQFLGSGDRCSIYDDRPQACRAFQCTDAFNEAGIGAQGVFLRRNPQVLSLLMK